MLLQDGIQEVVPSSTLTNTEAQVSPIKSQVIGLEAIPIKTPGLIIY